MHKDNQENIFNNPAIIILILALVFAGGYYLVTNSSESSNDQVAENTANESQDTQQEEIEFLREEIEKLKQENKSTKGKQAELEQKVLDDQESRPQDFSISTSEISSYIGGVTQVNCSNSEGTGFLMNIDIGYVTVTNDHVVSGNNQCATMPENKDGETLGHFQLDLTSPYEWNPYTDVAILKMSTSPAAQSWSKPISSLNYNLSNLRSCPSKMPEGSPVIVMGYPAFGKQQVQVEGYTSSISSRQVTEGIISGHDTSVEYPVGNLPYSNYYVSAKIDSGNSGGVALSKDGSGLCLLGVATWLSVGNFETQGVVQNIHNVFYAE